MIDYRRANVPDATGLVTVNLAECQGKKKMKFEWDMNKEQTNINKHGVSFEQAFYVFADPYALNQYDDDRSTKEDRWLILGKSINEVILVVVHTFKDQEGGWKW